MYILLMKFIRSLSVHQRNHDFAGSIKSRLEAGGSTEQQTVQDCYVGETINNCADTAINGVLKTWFPVTQWHAPVITDVVLIVVFNFNRFFWNNLPYLETMHRPYFK